MENTVDKNAEALEKIGDILSGLLSNDDMENTNSCLWEMFKDSVAYEDRDAETVYSRCDLYERLRGLLEALGKIQSTSGHYFKIECQPSTSSQS